MFLDLCLPHVDAELIGRETYANLAPFIRQGEQPVLIFLDLWTAINGQHAEFDVDAWEAYRATVLIDQCDVARVSPDIAALSAAGVGSVLGVEINPMPTGMWGFYDLRADPHGHYPPVARTRRRGGRAHD